MLIIINNANPIRIPINCETGTGSKRSLDGMITNIAMRKKRPEAEIILSTGISQMAKPAVVNKNAQTNCLVVIGSHCLFFESVIFTFSKTR